MPEPSSPAPSTDSPFIGAGFDTWAGSPFVQARLGLLGKTVFLLSFGFFLVVNSLLALGGGVHVLPMLVNQANIWLKKTLETQGKKVPEGLAAQIEAAQKLEAEQTLAKEGGGKGKESKGLLHGSIGSDS